MTKELLDLWKDAATSDSQPVRAALEVVGYLHKEAIDELYRQDMVKVASV